MRVRVFRNVTKGCFSIQAKARKGWRTVAHATDVVVSDAAFHVSEAGRQRVIRTRRKTVHAWVAGDLVAFTGSIVAGADALDTDGAMMLRTCKETQALPAIPGVPVSYNPYLGPSFIRRDTGAAVSRATSVQLAGGRVVAHSPS